MKKRVLSVVLATVFIFSAFAQDGDHKHEPFDGLIGLNIGFGATTNLGDLFGDIPPIPKGNYAMYFNAGLTFDFYLFSWLSFTTGLFSHGEMYLILDQDYTTVTSFTDIAATPICLTIPLEAHVNVPNLEWLYAGVGLTLNIPISSILEDQNYGVDTKGDFFIGIPIDIGFDFINSSGKGPRLFFRFMPEIHERGVTLPIGLVLQTNNWRIMSGADY
jgi:hypothetical protein